MANTRATAIQTTLTDSASVSIHSDSSEEKAIAYNAGGNGSLVLAASESGTTVSMAGVTSAAFVQIKAVDNPVQFKIDAGSQLELVKGGQFSASYGSKKPQTLTFYNPSTTDAVQIDYIITDV